MIEEKEDMKSRLTSEGDDEGVIKRKKMFKEESCGGEGRSGA